ncbi:hypothetical protein MFMK1_001671 [Metallumcola ferriviriculae]|uniref:Uncharacterized protein n=1 Tax=Metallumcola ferriviriculae TaxID=3039180 RepID=A0AAU0ULQ1_9FIRM|nr:hypothetical protein MFMK1_001671 [Desulfitibacteraceae bacterium MK1]
MTALLRRVGDVYVYVHAGLFITSLALQTLAGLTVLAVLLLGMLGIFS